MTATAERIEQDFAKLNREEQTQLFDRLYRQFLFQEDADWPISDHEKKFLSSALQEAEREIKAGRFISNAEMKQHVTEWLKTATR